VLTFGVGHVSFQHISFFSCYEVFAWAEIAVSAMPQVFEYMIDVIAGQRAAVQLHFVDADSPRV